jgi:alpha-glucoside transport system permease protein
MATQVITEQPSSIRRQLLGAVAGLTGIGIVVVGLAFLADKQQVNELVALAYSILGNATEAELVRDGAGNQLVVKLVLAVIGIAIGVGGVWLIYGGLNTLAERLRPSWRDRFVPLLFVGPAIALLIVYLVYPAISTAITSVTEDGGLQNYATLTSKSMISVFRNNVLWLVVATGGSVVIGLLIAGLVDRVRREALAKTFIFLPLAISLVGASVIWGFIYAWRPATEPQYGLLNAAITTLGGEAVPFIQTPVLNTFALIVIMIWLQTGFAMVVLSAAIKGVSTEVIEAARLDGANERQLFVRVVVPLIKGSIITVATTIAIAVMKIFDIVWVMTGGRADSDVVANRMMIEMFRNDNDGRAAALAVILLLAVVPLMLINLRNLRRQGLGA